MKCKNNNDYVAQIFLAVVGVILVGIIIYYVMQSVKSTTDITDTLIKKGEETAAKIKEYDIVKYDGEKIPGSEVVNFIKENLGNYSETETAPIYVKVITKKSGTTYTQTYTNKKYILDIKNFSSTAHYIKPTANFLGKVVRDKNEKILGIEFTQQ